MTGQRGTKSARVSTGRDGIFLFQWGERELAYKTRIIIPPLYTKMIMQETHKEEKKEIFREKSTLRSRIRTAAVAGECKFSIKVMKQRERMKNKIYFTI